jgi:hypothetical protein
MDVILDTQVCEDEDGADREDGGEVSSGGIGRGVDAGGCVVDDDDDEEEEGELISEVPAGSDEAI